MSYRLSITPDRLQSRVGSAFRVIAWSSEPLGAALAGLLIQVVGAVGATLLFASWVLVVAVGASVEPHLRRAVGQRAAIPQPADAPEHHEQTMHVCSFCRKRHDEVRPMVAGRDGVIICDGCVARCNEILAEVEGQPA